MTQGEAGRDRDAEKLAELGYKQELSRAWSGFSNFAISFTIISVLAGCFTVYGQAWNNGGPIAISWGWPIICGHHPDHRVLHVRARRRRTRPRAAPTGGRPSSAARAGRGSPAGSNVLGLVAVVASVDYARGEVRERAVQPRGASTSGSSTSPTAPRWARSSSSSSLILVAPRADQHLLVAPRRAVQQHLACSGTSSASR